jgi:alanyl-tRNA synthetase
VRDTQKVQPDVFGHHGEVKTGELRVGDIVAAQVDPDARARAAWNHSATHLMHAALRKVLGDHVQQKGSLVDPERTRFDFSHPQPMTRDEIRTVESLVNRAIRANYPVEAQVMKYDDAMKSGAVALFGEKYGDEVRVLRMGDFSTELCGGTHVQRTGDIGFFKITSESGVAAGIRRVEAVTGEGALAYTHEIEARLNEAAAALKSSTSEIGGKIQQLQEGSRSLEKELARAKAKLATSRGGDLLSEAVEVNGARVLAATVEGADAKTLRDTLDQLKSKLKSAAIVLGSTDGGKVTLIAGVTADLTSKIKAGDLVNHVATQVGGKGGGRADMAQAGGTDPAGLPAALASVKSWVEERL